ncbi:aminotransferase class I/II-fold pyridoxal phosphate-dependent enzyme [Mycolicibacter longobardus]|uniref:aminotransferase class I/II-fold pyridoxal phosphate-dependent enzyme n=1 Tax=Mycolicibacter longobardus TaxID=1108812 RepID=UPI0021F2D50B|nr:aminotransferase class I/II-fold pyridoxal phosphate-dependent enzyme [Mycolicibacter longobardus]MCV7386343.1 aminotransferase class I/II-fold pyridoxal phosphate-dependent enzyme [Mycolicibacter longobardus]
MTAAALSGSATAHLRRGFPSAVDPCALSLNENPLPPLPAVRSALTESIGAANRYPDFLPTRLRRLVADHVGVPETSVAIGPGASGLAIRVLSATASPGDRIVLSQPTFDGYPVFARIAGLAMVDVPLDDYGHYDLVALSRAAADARVVVLCRPHNPTGTLEPVADVERFIASVPERTIVLLDEAYIEFVSPGQRIDVPDLIRRFPNVVVLRTFSKAYGLAGLRIGYALAAPGLAGTLWAMQVPFGISTSCTVAVAASYDAEAQLQQRIAHIVAERSYLRSRLRASGIYTTDSHANFVYLPAAGRPWREMFDGTDLRVRSYPDGAVRITVGARSSTRMVLSAVEQALSAPGSFTSEQ